MCIGSQQASVCLLSSSFFLYRFMDLSSVSMEPGEKVRDQESAGHAGTNYLVAFFVLCNIMFFWKELFFLPQKTYA